MIDDEDVALALRVLEACGPAEFDGDPGPFRENRREVVLCARATALLVLSRHLSRRLQIDAIPTPPARETP